MLLVKNSFNQAEDAESNIVLWYLWYKGERDDFHKAVFSKNIKNVKNCNEHLPVIKKIKNEYHLIDYLMILCIWQLLLSLDSRKKKLITHVFKNVNMIKT